MAAFEYLALTTEGKRKKGVMEGDSAKQIRQLLRSEGLSPLEVNEVAQRKSKADKTDKSAKPSFFNRKKITAIELSLITRQLATLLEAAIPLDEALTSVARQTEKNHVKGVLLGVRSKVMEGHTLAAGMEEFPRAFPLLYRTTVAAGERSGKLDKVLLRLAEYTERQHEIRQKVRQALVYPSMMTVVSIGVVIFLLVYVVPKIVAVFHQTKQVLPLSTTILISISSFMQHYGWFLLGGMVIVGYLLWVLLKRKAVRRRWHHFLVRIPVIGRTIQTVNGARFGRTFGILNAASVPILEAMQAAAKLIMIIPMREAVEAAIEKVREGSHIHYALEKTHYFAPMFIHLVASGETSGRLDDMLEKAAMQQERDVENLIDNTLTLFEPVLILVMGAVVLFIVLAIMLPIFAMDQFSGSV